MSAIVSLFSGAGGLSFGFAKAGLNPSFAADIDTDACETYGRNLRTEAHALDLGADDWEPLRRRLAPHRRCMAVIGGPPCQGFSTAGARRAEDPRNGLVFRYLDIVEYLSPRWFLFENVEGLLTAGGGASLGELAACFIDLGYTLRIEKINFAGFGLPQSRKRVIIMGNRVGSPFRLPLQGYAYRAGKHQSRFFATEPLPSSPSLIEAIGDLPPASLQDEPLSFQTAPMSAYAAALRGEAATVREHFFKLKLVEEGRYALLGQGQTMKDLPEEAWHPSYRARAFRRVSDGMPSEKRGGPPAGIRRLVATDAAPTITSAATREFIHPVENRPLTLRETARLQSFPDAYDFAGSHRARAMQIGNAVPPLAAAVLAEHLGRCDGAAGGGGRIARPVSPGLLGFHLTDAAGKSPALQRTEELLGALPRAVEGRSYAYG